MGDTTMLPPQILTSTAAVRYSLENFGEFDYIDKEDSDIVRYVNVCPLYALSQIDKLTNSLSE